MILAFTVRKLLYTVMHVELFFKELHTDPVTSFFYFLFYRFFSQQVSVGGRNKNKIHSDHFPIELKSKETHFRRKHNCVSFNFNSIGPFSNLIKIEGNTTVLPSILIHLENGPNEFYFTN